MEFIKRNWKITVSVFGILIIVLYIAFSGSDLAAFSPFAGSTLYINEVVTSNGNSLTDPALGSPDWIEIYNAGSSDVNLKGYKLVNNKNKPNTWEFPDVILKSGEYLVIKCADASDGIPQDTLCTGYRLPKSGVTLALMNSYNRTLNKVVVPELATDISWGRTEDGNYKYMKITTPKAKNIGGVDSLEELAKDINSSKIRLSEVMPGNSTLKDKDGKYLQWAEIYNASDSAQRLGDYCLSDNVSKPTKWQFPDIEIAPGEYKIVFLSGGDSVDTSELHTTFQLGADENSLLLSDKLGNAVDLLQWDITLPTYVSFGRLQNGKSAYFSQPTPGQPNSESATSSKPELRDMTGNDPVRISEILDKNTYSLMDEDGDRPGWVEIYNSSSKPVELKNYCLSDNENDISKWRFPDITIAPGEYKVVFLSGKDRADTLHASFKLGSADTVLILTDLKNVCCDRVKVPSDMKENVSYGLNKSGLWMYYPQPTPHCANTAKGFDKIASIQKIDSSGIWINEVRAAEEAKSGKLDWVEIANGGSRDVNLKGYYLSDDIDNPQKWKIPDTTIPAGGYQVIYTSSKGSRQTALVAKFGIGVAGEKIMLSSPQGNFIDVMDTGVLNPGITSGRVSGDYSGTRFFFTTMTPGAKNAPASYASYAAKPSFSALGGYIAKSVNVEITCSTPNARIYYTLDGSKPTEVSTLYTSPIAVDGTTTLRAVAYADGMLKSEVQTVTYLREDKHTIPIICISSNPSDFRTVYGVTEMGVELEREAYIEYYEADGTLGVSFPAGIRVIGASTRTAAQKSLNIALRGAYGKNEITYPFFDGYGITTFKSLRLRNSGQDRGEARVRDAFASLLVQGMDVDAAMYRPVCVYINGQYWGLYDLKENTNKDYYASHYGVNADTVNIVQRNVTRVAGDNTEFKVVRAYAKSHNMSNEEYYKELCKKVDVQAFMDYMIAQTYICNSDMFNQKYARTTDYKVKWRQIFFDLDFCLREGSASRSIMGAYFVSAGIPSADGSLSNMDIQSALIENPGFKEAYIERYAYHLNNTFKADRLLSILDSMVAEMESEMPRHIERWNAPSSMQQWKNCVAELRDIVEVRTKYVKQHLKSYFGLSDERMKELFPNG